MAETAIKKLFNYFVGEEPDEMVEEVEEVMEESGYQDNTEGGMDALSGIFKKKSKIVQMPQTQQIKMNIVKPTNYDHAKEIIGQLKDKNAVVFNLEYVSKDVARRIIDTVSGAVEALDANLEKVSNSIFVAAPCNYDIINELNKEKIESKFSASWIK